MTSLRTDSRSLLVCEEDSGNGVEMNGSRSKFRQHVAAILANLATLCIGMANAWTAPALPIIQRETDVIIPLFATEDQASWISSLLPIGAVVGALPAGCLADKFGRKRVLLTMAVPYFLGWVLIILASESIMQVYAGRFITGLAAGMWTVLVPLYNEEIAEDSIRGALGVYFDFMLCVGILLMYVIGAFLPYMQFTTMCSMIPLVYFIVFLWMPESPTFLVSKQLMPEAEKALMWLRNTSMAFDTNIQAEMKLLIFRSRMSARRNRRMICNRTMFKAVALIFGLMFFQQWSGINAIIYYTVQIFNDAGSSLSASACSMVIGVVEVIATLIPTITVDKLGRRPLLLASSFFMSMCLALLSGYFYFKENNYNIDMWRWLPLTSIVVYMIALSIGFGPLPFFMMAELVPTSVKGSVSAMSISFNWGMTFLVTKLFPITVRTAGEDVTYGILCGLSILGGLFVLIFVPETKGKSREEIQDVLENGSVAS